MRAAYSELWRLLTRKSVHHKHWRDFWTLLIPSIVIGVTIVVLTGAPFFPWGLLIVVVVALIIARVARIYWRRTRDE